MSFEHINLVRKAAAAARDQEVVRLVQAWGALTLPDLRAQQLGNAAVRCVRSGRLERHRGVFVLPAQLTLEPGTPVIGSGRVH